MGNRIVVSARSILNQFLPDIYIYTDHRKGVNSGKWVPLCSFELLFSNFLRFFGFSESLIQCFFNCRSPGFGLTLVAETLNGCFLSAEMSSVPQGQGIVLPEDLGRNCAKRLLEEVYRVSVLLGKNKNSFKIAEIHDWIS